MKPDDHEPKLSTDFTITLGTKLITFLSVQCQTHVRKISVAERTKIMKPALHIAQGLILHIVLLLYKSRTMICLYSAIPVSVSSAKATLNEKQQALLLSMSTSLRQF